MGHFKKGDLVKIKRVELDKMSPFVFLGYGEEINYTGKIVYVLHENKVLKFRARDLTDIVKLKADDKCENKNR